MPIPQSLLDRNRRELLDLSTRNRLISIPVNSKSARVVHIRDEKTSEVFRLLVDEKKAMSFLPGRKSVESAESTNTNDDEVELPQPDDDLDATTGLGRRHSDLRLQTALTSEGLQRRLLDLHDDAQTMIEEQGVNILYLALGHLQWFEAEQSDVARFAPLLLLPVELERAGAGDRFKLKARDEEVQENLSLAAKLQADFNLQLPVFPSSEDFEPRKYLAAVAKSVSEHAGWQVLPDAMTLGFFSFAKFLMYRDLDSANWPQPEGLLAHPFVTGLMQDGFPVGDDPFAEDASLDELIPVERLDHVVDADGSQTIAIEQVRRGRSLVIQGPPGTGKSQSITNIIATAVMDGKRVLFVAEKLAALEVVKRRLEREGLGPLCLELHSNKAHKRAVLEEIGRTWKLGRPITPPEIESTIPRLTARRGTLNAHALALHTPLQPSGIAPFTVIGRLAALGDRARNAADVALLGAETWTFEDIRERQAVVAELCERITTSGLPGSNPWRGSRRATVLKVDFEAIVSRVHAARAAAVALKAAANDLASKLLQNAPPQFADIAEVVALAEHIAAAPPLDRKALCNGIWSAGLEGLRELLAHGDAFAQAQKAVGAQVIADAFGRDFRVERQTIAAHGESLFRILNGDYRKAMAAVRGVMAGAFPKKYAERLALLDGVIAGQRAVAAIRAGAASGQAAFGSVWKNENTDWSQVRAILKWIESNGSRGLSEDFRTTFAAIDQPAEIGPLTRQVNALILEEASLAAALLAELQLDVVAAFGAPEIHRVATHAWLARCDEWITKIEIYPKWTGYHAAAERAKHFGLGVLVERLASGSITSNQGAEAFEYALYCHLYRGAAHRSPELGQFDGDLHTQRVAEFRKLDRDRLALAKYRVLSAHHSRMPPSSGAMGATGIVKGELERKRGHRAVRALINDAGTVVQAIKPVFMMSPLSVAQYLAPGAVEFDLLVIDEASQVQPVDALGAIARCKQIVVVGDSRQLPPTRFFNRVTSDAPDADETEEAAAAEAKDVESILGLCRARGLSERMLRWHYRSRHHSLIAVSNREFYENQLFIVPSPWSAAGGLGLKFRHVPEGIFDRGGTSTNRIEAQTVARAVIRHARETPKLSLGVAAFGMKQQQAIRDELELMRRENPDTEPFFNERGPEPFFVKNLENVQGDERDVIFISVGYGRDLSGYMAMAFGPLGADGGERRLNVLISRAKRRCEVFSSIVGEDIDLERAKGRGVAALKTFLIFAQTGRLSTAVKTGRDEDSPLEESIKTALESLGHEVHQQIGLAGFFVDLAVVDREKSGRYLVGIECDGASYHSSRSARDRDRLRQAVLEDHGWIIHRVWSTDWYQRPREELAKIGQVIERAKGMLSEELADEAKPEISVEVTIETETPSGISREILLDLDAKTPATFTQPYSEARFEVLRSIEPHELSTKGMTEVLLKIIAHETPIHEDELVTRVRELWGLTRAGSRIQDAVARAVRALLISKQCVRDDNSLMLPGSPVPIRNRAGAQSPGLRKPELLPGPEIRALILALIEAHHGAKKAELPSAVARAFGFKAAGATLRSVVEYQIKRLLKNGALTEASETLQKTQV